MSALSSCTMLHAEHPDERVTFRVEGPKGHQHSGEIYYVVGIEGGGTSLSIFLSPERLTELRDVLTAAIAGAESARTPSDILAQGATEQAPSTGAARLIESTLSEDD